MRYDDFLDEQALKTYTNALNSRARALGLSQVLSVADVRGVVLESAGICAYCNINLLQQAFELDHIIPLAERGAHHPANLVLTCPDCNRKKAHQSPLKFALSTIATSGVVTATLQRIVDFYQAQAQVQGKLFEE
jgi:5-methylcytosine-specific restriction endonuclease McrA